MTNDFDIGGCRPKVAYLMHTSAAEFQGNAAAATAVDIA
jgi:hypothetical protein